MRRDLPAYDKFRRAVVERTRQGGSLSDFTHALKNDVRLRAFRTDARSELKRVYDRAAKDLSLPDIPVFLSKRMTVSKRSQAQLAGETPSEIRIYPIKGISGVSYDNWDTQDIRVCTKYEVFEILSNEIAQVLVSLGRFEADDHSKALNEAYRDVKSYFLRNDYGGLIEPEDESLAHSSYSTKERIAEAWGAKTRHPDGKKGDGTLVGTKSSSRGCFTMIAAAVLIIAALAFIL